MPRDIVAATNSERRRRQRRASSRGSGGSWGKVRSRDVGLIASAVARPQTTIGGDDAYPTLWGKAAALLQSVVDNHALIDGNERLGWLATAVFLEINNASVAAAPNDAVYDLVMAVATSEYDLQQIASRLPQLAQRP